MNEIKQFLADNSMTQAEFARGLGITQGLVGQWVAGIRPVSIEKALMIEDTYGLQAETLNNDVKLIRSRSTGKNQQAA